MGYRKDLESYLSLSRKELQVLCKSNNLPANRSHTQLAKSLAIFSRKKHPPPSSLKEQSVDHAMPKESRYLSEVKSKDLIGLDERRTKFVESGSNEALFFMKENEDDEKQHSLAGHTGHQALRNVYSNATDTFCTVNLGPKQFDHSISNAGNSHLLSSVAASIQQIEKGTGLLSERHLGRTFNGLKRYSGLRKSHQQALNHAASTSDGHNSIPIVMPRDAKSSRKGGSLSLEDISMEEIPSFQFFVSSEEGVDLHVDLNSSPSEWINSLKDEVYINLKLQESMSTSLPKQSGISSAGDTHMKISDCENIDIDHHGNRVDRNSDCTTSTLSSHSENFRSMATFASSDSSVLTSNQVIPSCVTPLSGEKCLAFDAFSEDMVDSSSRMEKINTSGISMITDMSMPNPERATNTEQMECPTQKIDDVQDTIETNGLCTLLASIPEENNLLNSDETEETLTFEVDNLEKDTDACEVSIEGGPVVGRSEVAAVDHCGDGGDSATTGSHSDANFKCVAFNLDTSSVKDPVILNQELGKSSEAEEEEISECSRSEKLSENNSKRALSLESNEELSSKRHHSNENKNGMIVNLRSTRTLAKETKSGHVRPRRSTRLLEVKLK